MRDVQPPPHAPARSYGLSGLRALLSCFGGILSCTEVRLASLPAPAAHVCFATAKGLARALEAASEDLEPLEPPPEEACEVAGLTAWVAAHRAARPGLAALQAQLDEWVAADEAASEAAARASEAAAAGEEGWTVVGRKQGRRKTAAGDAEGTTVGSVAPAKARSKATLKGPMVTHGDFYRFQRHEKQRDAVLELREKFKADTQRIAELRKQRAFKPY